MADRADSLRVARRLLGAGVLGLTLGAGCSADGEGADPDGSGAVRHPLRLVLCSAPDTDPGCISPRQPGADGGGREGAAEVIDLPDGEARDNVQRFLEALPPIESAQAQQHQRELEDGLRQALRAYGYYSPDIRLTLRTADAAADGAEERPATLAVAIDAGKRMYLRDVQLRIIGEGRGLRPLEQILSDSQVKPYAPLSHEQYEALKESLRHAALSLGFFDVRFAISRMLVHEELNCADIILVLDTGRRYRFGELEFEDEQSQALFTPARSLLGISPGQEFSTAEVSRLNADLMQTGYYRIIDLTYDRSQAGDDLQVPLHLRLERQHDNIVRGGIGYSTDEGPRLMLGWDKPLLNLSGHSLQTYAQVSMVQQNAQAVYKIPRRSPNTDYYYLRAAQEHTDLNDTLSDRSHLSFHYVANQTGRWRRDYALTLEYEDYEQGLESGRTLNLMPGVRLSRSMGDQGLDPRTAQNFSITVNGGLHQISDATFLRWDARYRLILSPTENTRFVVRAQQGATWGRDSLKVPPSQRFFAGGDSSIRGYGYLNESTRRDGYLKGSRYLTLGSAELQFPFGLEQQRLAVFLDAGLPTDDYEDLHEYLLGPGIGYRLITGMGVVRLDLAYGMDREPARIRLHFGFGPGI